METIVVAAIGVTGTLLAALLGQLIGVRTQSASERRATLLAQKRDAYSQFIAVLETIQVELDRCAISRERVDANRYWTRMRDLEECRTRIDLFASARGRRWAYRCRIAVDAIERALDGADYSLDEVVMVRVKLHLARLYLVAAACEDLGVVRDDVDFGATDRPTYSPAADSFSGHLEWLDSPANADAIDDVRIALRMEHRAGSTPVSDGPGAVRTSATGA